MIIKPAAINHEGIDTVVTAGNTPARLRLVDHVVDDTESWETSWKQTYIPGISIPTIPELIEPFMVPVIGDNESVSLTVSWPRRASSDLIKIIEFAGQLPAEAVTRIPDSDDPLIDDLERYTEREMQNLFDDYTGEWGAFLYVRAEEYYTGTRLSTRGMSEFIVMETAEEFERISSLLDGGEVSAIDIVRITQFTLKHSGVAVPNVLP